MRSRDEAQNNGLVRFYTGVPCKRGHLSERFVSNGACVECVNRIAKVKGPTQEWFQPQIILEAPISGEHRNELNRLLEGWCKLKMREWGYPV
jgi:hypothetical protein